MCNWYVLSASGFAPTSPRGFSFFSRCCCSCRVLQCWSSQGTSSTPVCSPAEHLYCGKISFCHCAHCYHQMLLIRADWHFCLARMNAILFLLQQCFVPSPLFWGTNNLWRGAQQQKSVLANVRKWLHSHSSINFTSVNGVSPGKCLMQHPKVCIDLELILFLVLAQRLLCTRLVVLKEISYILHSSYCWSFSVSF